MMQRPTQNETPVASPTPAPWPLWSTIVLAVAGVGAGMAAIFRPELPGAWFAVGLAVICALIVVLAAQATLTHCAYTHVARTTAALQGHKPDELP